MSHRETILNQKDIQPADGMPEGMDLLVVFADDSNIKETECSWKYFSNMKKVKYQNGMKTIMVSKYPVKRIYIFHKEQDFHVDIPEGCEVYQAIRGSTQFVPNREQIQSILGRAVGIVKNDEVIEEYVVDNISNQITGWRK